MKLIAGVLIALAASASARIHTWCTCTINGKDSVELAENTCVMWGQTQPHTSWDSGNKACADFHPHGGIDGDPWERTCKQEYQFAYNGNPNKVKGRCWS